MLLGINTLLRISKFLKRSLMWHMKRAWSGFKKPEWSRICIKIWALKQRKHLERLLRTNSKQTSTSYIATQLRPVLFTQCSARMTPNGLAPTTSSCVVKKSPQELREYTILRCYRKEQWSVKFPFQL